MKTSSRLTYLTVLLAALLTAGCATTYYNTMEKFGIHKRDILVDRVQEARDAQVDSKQQFKSSLDRFSKELNFSGGELEDKYEKLNDEYEESEEKAAEVSHRIAKVEEVADALFDEWKQEISEYTSSKLRRSSEQKLSQTKRHYRKLLTAMKRAESKMAPVLGAFKDQVLFLKHNLNAKAIASLQGELVSIEGSVTSLIKEMEASIKEADTFIATIAEE
jgi:hypothetical protein